MKSTGCKILSALVPGLALNAAFAAAGDEAARFAAFARAAYERELIAPVVNTAPGPEFSASRLDFAMNAGMALTKGGRLWAAWHAGGDGPRAFLVGTWSDDGGKTWCDTRFALCSPKPVATHALGFDAWRVLEVNVSCLVANLWAAPDGTLRLFACVSVNGFDGRGALYQYVCRNPDDANPVWSEGRRIGWGGAHNKPQVLADGTWILPNDFEAFARENFPELDPLRGCGLLASSDGGQTWTRRGYVRPEGTTLYAEHQVAVCADGSFLMYLRTGFGLQESRSTDGGFTWTVPKPPAALRQILSRFGFVRLANGHFVFVKNGANPMLELEGEGLDRRRDLTAFVSVDDGRTWKGGLVLDPRIRVAYPDIFVAPDGFIYVSYEHGRATAKDEILFARFTEDDILAGRLVAAGSSLRRVIFSEGKHEE